MRAMIYGGDQRRIGGDVSGVLKIGTTEIKITPEEDSILPILYHGATGRYLATFTDVSGNVYDIGKILVRNGKIVPPTEVEVELMELRCRLDTSEDECEALREKIRELENIFDTNSLNFLIK
jgi:hypothetical protein